MTDNEITEAYFVARGWKLDETHAKTHYWCWWDLDNNKHEFLPNILEYYSAFREHVLEGMAAEGYFPRIADPKNYYDLPTEAQWIQGGCKDCVYYEIIRDQHWLRAAVVAATRYWEGKRG